MTTLWEPKGWEGQTVAVLGNAPGLRAQLARLPDGCKTIAASRAINVYPQADMMVAIDGNGGPADFAGLHVVGSPGDGPGLYVGMWYERATLAAGHQIEFRNTGLLAIRVAAMMGAARIVLAGFDTQRYEAFHRDGFAAGTSACTAEGVTQAFDALLADLRGKGVDVVALEDEPEAASDERTADEDAEIPAGDREAGGRELARARSVRE